MLLERTISQLDIGRVAQAKALELGQLGYMQWLGALPAMSNYREAAIYAHAKAIQFSGNSPAVAVFCDLLDASIRGPLAPLHLKLPDRQRRGGSRARRAAF